MLGATEPPIINPTSINASGFGNLEHVFIIFALIYLGVGLVGLFAWAKILSKAGYSGWWVLIVLVPFIGALIGFVMFFVFAFSEWPIERQLAMARSRQGQPIASHAPGLPWTAPVSTPPAQAPGGYAPSGYAASGYGPSGYPPSGYASSGFVPARSMPGGPVSGRYPPPADGSPPPPAYSGPGTGSTETASPATSDPPPTSDPPASEPLPSDPSAGDAPAADAPPVVRRSRYLPTNRTPPPPPPPNFSPPSPPPPPSTEGGSS
jgi:hypothetical protein